MKYIKVICIILFVFLFSSCKNKEKKVVNKNTSKKIEINTEVINSTIEAFVDRMVSEEHFKGVILATKNNKIIHIKGYGMANKSTKNNIKTKFHVASITKQFTATAIMQLVEQGKINLENSINDFLPVRYHSDKWNGVNIHHLLSHTSGIEDYAVTRDYYEVENGFCLGNTVDGMIKEAMTKDLHFLPGSKFSYSNIGFTLLGKIIENTTGEPFHLYLKENVLEPQGMNSSFIHTTDYSAASDEAIGYKWDGEQNKHVLDDIVSLPVTQADGNLVTTLSDFYKWTNIYVQPKNEILKMESLKKMLTPISKDGDSQMYGYGIGLNNGTICHSGYIVGFRSHFIVNPKEDIRVFVFSNNVSNNPRNVSTGIYEILSEINISEPL